MALVSMIDKLAIMLQVETIIQVDGASFTVPGTIPFTSSADFIEIPNGTVIAIMYNAQSPSGKILQVFSYDEIKTVS